MSKPTLDVSFVLDMAEFQDTLTVTRSPVDNTGQINPATQTTFTIQAVCEQGMVEPLEMQDDQSHTRRSLAVYTRTRLYDVTVDSSGVTGFQPDIVNYNGTLYKVIKLWDYSRYGTGYYAADCDIYVLETQQ